MKGIFNIFEIRIKSRSVPTFISMYSIDFNPISTWTQLLRSSSMLSEMTIR